MIGVLIICIVVGIRQIARLPFPESFVVSLYDLSQTYILELDPSQAPAIHHHLYHASHCAGFRQVCTDYQKLRVPCSSLKGLGRYVQIIKSCVYPVQVCSIKLLDSCV